MKTIVNTCAKAYHKLTTSWI